MYGTWVTQQQAHKQLFLDHINSIDPNVKFTVKGNQENGAIPFLDTLVEPEADNSLTIRVYHMPTHTDQYLQWDSHHNLSTKYSAIGTLTHRAKSDSTTSGLLNEELQYLKEALVRCKHSHRMWGGVHQSTQSTYRTPAQQGQLQYNRQGGAGHCKIN